MTTGPVKRKIGSGDSKKGMLITDFFQMSKPAAKKSKIERTDTKIERSEAGAVLKEKVEVAESAATTQDGSKEEEPIPIKTSNEKVASDEPTEDDYTDFCKKHNFNKEEWVASLNAEEKQLLQLEIHTLHITWLVFLHKELTKPYFLKLKKFLALESRSGKTIFPPSNKVYSWSHYTPLPKIKCLILGQDPYHNHNQAHGLAFSVLNPTKPPPSLVNIYKALKIDFPNFEIPKSGDLTNWAEKGILMLNAVLTVEAHKANSHANQGWETFTEEIIKTAINYFTKEKSSGFVIMAWGSPAQKRVGKFGNLLSQKFMVIKSVHPSPLSAHRGFFDLNVFKKCNEWLQLNHLNPLDWGLINGNVV
ncbi:uracil-DNA glycosylase, partial [Hyphopichia burtonii NRRL Y-1933]